MANWNGSRYNRTQFHRQEDFMLDYFSPTVTVLGIIGNFMAAIIFSHNKKLRQIPSSHYLATMCSSDVGVLITSLFQWLSTQRVAFNIVTLDGFCQGILYCSYVFSFLSVWSIVAYSVELYYLQATPEAKSKRCTVLRSKCVIFSLAAFSVVYYLYVVLLSGVFRHGGVIVCTPKLEELVIQIMQMINLLIVDIIPDCILIVLNVLLIRNSLKCGIPLENSELTETSDNFLIQEPARNGFRTESEPEIRPSRRNTGCRSGVPNASLKRVLLLISSMYLICSIPQQTLKIKILVDEKLREISAHESILEKQIHDLLYRISMLRVVLDVVICMVFSPEFRESIKGLVMKVLWISPSEGKCTVYVCRCGEREPVPEETPPESIGLAEKNDETVTRQKQLSE